MRSRLCVFFFLFFAVSARAQTDSVQAQVSSCRYFNRFVAGALVGDEMRATTLSVALLQGIRINRFEAGAGIGLDTYHDWHTLPVFGFVALDIARIRSGAIFLQLAMGGARSWMPRRANDGFDYDSDNGRILHPAIGYRLRSHQWSIYLIAGYKFQRISYEQTPQWGTWFPPTVTSVIQDKERLTIELGFGLH